MQSDQPTTTPRHPHGLRVVPTPDADAGDLTIREDDELMQLAAGGLRSAFAELTRRYASRVRGYCLKWNPSLGDDLAQEVFLKLWQARRDYQPRGKFSVYLFTIVRNGCRNARRGWLRRPSFESMEAEAVESGAPDGLDRVLERERVDRVQRALPRLSPKLREAVLLRFAEEMSYSDMATILNVPQATARGRVFHGLRRLQEVLS